MDIAAKIGISRDKLLMNCLEGDIGATGATSLKETQIKNLLNFTTSPISSPFIETSLEVFNSFLFYFILFYFILSSFFILLSFILLSFILFYYHLFYFILFYLFFFF